MTRHDYITALVANDEAEQTQESVCVVCMCFWYGMPPGFGFVCQVILLKKMDYSAYKGIMHLNFPIVCMYACMYEKMGMIFVEQIFFLLHFIYFYIMMFFVCLF